MAYENDTSIIITAANETEIKSRVNETMHTIASWSERAEIQLNKEKTEIMSIGKTNVKSITIGECEIQTKRHLKHLGLVIDDKLLWHKQLDHLSNNCFV